MRSRDVTIPLGLWICAAVGAHFFLGTGGLVVAAVHDDRSELWSLARQASNLTAAGEQTFEIALSDSTEPAAAPEPPPPPPAPTVKPPAAAPAKPREVPHPDDKPKPTKTIVAVETKADKKVVLPPDALNDRRIAVRQHVTPDQDDNPTARFIADEANRVASESVATQTSHDRDDEKPTPGINHPSSDTQPGDSERTRIAEHEDRRGETRRAPGERGTDFDVVHEPRLAQPNVQSDPMSRAAAAPSRAASTETDARSAARASERSELTPGSGDVAAPSPDVQSAPGGAWTFNPASAGGAQGASPVPKAGDQGSELPGGKLWSLPGLGATPPPGALNVNVGASQIAAIVGTDTLRREREADGERRKSEHRGSWAAASLERWRSAIENYVSDVKPGNQTALNAARVPFASYLNGMHNRIHPIFADSFLESLDNLPATHPLNDQHLVTILEIVLTREGRLRRMGVVRASGVTAFDIGALDSVDRAQPFGPAPGAIVSPDGNVYLHWEFHREEALACSTFGARPYLLAAPPPSNEAPTPPVHAPPASPGREHQSPASPNDSREGRLVPARAGGRAMARRPT
jgi:TonB family protein